jgi:hypothetical protein
VLIHSASIRYYIIIYIYVCVCVCACVCVMFLLYFCVRARGGIENWIFFKYNFFICAWRNRKMRFFPHISLLNYICLYRYVLHRFVYYIILCCCCVLLCACVCGIFLLLFLCARGGIENGIFFKYNCFLFARGGINFSFLFLFLRFWLATVIGIAVICMCV